jgi:multicomponent Na+:H+ antiporter subunit G
MSYLAMGLVLVGVFFVLAAVVGILRLPDFYCRLHAMGKCDTLGVTLVMAGLAVHEGFTLNSAKLALMVLFIALANPTATHAIGRAALLSGLKPWTRLGGTGETGDTAFHEGRR